MFKIFDFHSDTDVRLYIPLMCPALILRHGSSQSFQTSCLIEDGIQCIHCANDIDVKTPKLKLKFNPLILFNMFAILSGCVGIKESIFCIKTEGNCCRRDNYLCKLEMAA